MHLSGRRRVEYAVGSAMLMQGAMYLAIVPLLPEITERFGLSSSGAAALLAIYSVVILVVSLLAAQLTRRFSPRTLVVVANIALAAATVLFAFAPTALLLGLARGGQGIGAGILYTAGLSWVVSITPAEERGASAGRTMALVSLGTVIGPAIGALAGATSLKLAFSLVAVVSVGTTALALSTPASLVATSGSRVESASLRRAIRHPWILAATLCALLSGFAATALELLLPLRLGDLGRSSTAIGICIVGGALVATIFSARVGSLIDGVGVRVAMLAIGGGFIVLTFVSIPLARSSLSLLVILGVLGPTVMACLIVMSKLAADGADAARVSTTAATALTGVAWPLGAIIGPNVGGLLDGGPGLRVALAVIGAIDVVLVAGCVVATRRPAVTSILEPVAPSVPAQCSR